MFGESPPVAARNPRSKPRKGLHRAVKSLPSMNTKLGIEQSDDIKPRRSPNRATKDGCSDGRSGSSRGEHQTCPTGQQDQGSFYMPPDAYGPQGYSRAHSGASMTKRKSSMNHCQKPLHLHRLVPVRMLCRCTPLLLCGCHSCYMYLVAAGMFLCCILGCLR
jgi:hypothetical protein